MTKSELARPTGQRPQAPVPAARRRSPMMDARRLLVHSVRPLNAETPPEELGLAEVTPTGVFFVRTHGGIPQPDVRTFQLTVDGEVCLPLTLALPELLARFARVTVPATVACAGNRRNELRPTPPGIPWGPGAIGTATWSGVRLRDVLHAAGLTSQARKVAFTGLDDIGGERFAGSIPIEKALAAEVLLADEMNGARLPAEHGFPLRVVVPGYIGARSVKWLATVTVTREPSTSAFQCKDYALHGAPLGEPPLTCAVCRPADGEVVGTRVRLEGYAVGAGGRPVAQVEVSADAGRTWSLAILHGRPQPWTWQLWHADLYLPPGVRELVARATDAGGTRQPRRVDHIGNPSGYLNNSWHRIRVIAIPDPAATACAEAVQNGAPGRRGARNEGRGGVPQPRDRTPPSREDRGPRPKKVPAMTSEDPQTGVETFQLSLDAAERYEAAFVPAIFAEWAPRLVQIAGVSPGQEVLDAACGTGIVARTVAERLAGSGRVVGLDLNEAMLAVARRVRPDVDWRQGDLVDLPFPDGSFDVVLCQMALMFVADRSQALREMARVVRPGGTVAVCVPAGLDDQPAYGPFVELAVLVAGPAARSLLGSYWVCGDLEELTATVAAAGLQVAETRTELGTARFDSPEQLAVAEVEGSPLLHRISEPQYARIREGSAEVLRSFVDSAGRLAAPLRVHLVAARSPG